MVVAQGCMMGVGGGERRKGGLVSKTVAGETNSADNLVYMSRQNMRPSFSGRLGGGGFRGEGKNRISRVKREEEGRQEDLRPSQDGGPLPFPSLPSPTLLGALVIHDHPNITFFRETPLCDAMKH